MSDTVIPPAGPSEYDMFFEVLCRSLNKKKPVIPEDSTAVDIDGLKTDFNDLLAKLRTAFE